MKSIIITFFASFILLTSLRGQWEIVNEGIGIQFNSGYFINKDTGWLAGNNVIYKTTDGGKNWNTFWVNIEYICTFHFFNDLIGWVIDGNGGIFKTLDGGHSWFRQVASVAVYRIYVVSENIVYAIGDGVLKTSNGGSTWVDISPQNEGGSFGSACFLNTDTGIVACGNIIYRTYNGGVAWSKKVMTEGCNIYNVKFMDDSTIYFVASVESSGQYIICKITDFFSLWSVLYVNNYYIYACHFFTDDIIIAIMADSITTNIRKSKNGGQTWEKADAAKLPQFFLYDLCFGADNVGYIIGTRNGYNIILKSVDQGNNWTFLDLTYPFKDVYFINRDKGFVVGGNTEIHDPFGSVLKTYDRAKSWDFINNQRRCPINCHFTNDSNGFLLCGAGSGRNIKYSELYQTLDGGNNWFNNSRGIEEELCITDLFFVNEHIGYAAVRDLESWCNGSIYKTANGGEFWYKIWNYNKCGIMDIYLNSIFFIDESTGWAVGEDGIIFKLTDQETLKEIVSGTDLPLNKVFFVDKDTGWIAGGYNNEDDFRPILLKTENGGESWTKIENVNFLIHDFYFKDALQGWAVGEDNNGKGIIIVTNNGGNNWYKSAGDLSGPLRAIQLNEGVWWAVGDNGLILNAYDSTLTVIDEITITKNSNDILLQNYPNPFTSNTVIGYRLTVYGEVELNVSDLTGRKVTTLLKEKQQLGNYEIEWNAEGIKPGIYWCELKTESSRKAIKMVLLK
jgi:photosystem II stability/assembly factor-like uncharacterized protein